MNNLLSRSIVRPNLAAMGAVLVSLVMCAGAWAGADCETVVISDEHATLFGRSIAVNDDWLVIGANAAAFVFSKTSSGWSPVQKLKPVDAGSCFGDHDLIRIEGDRIVIGSRCPQAVYVFEWTDDDEMWLQTAKLTVPDDPGAFGSSVALDGDMIVVGATHAVTVGTPPMSPYVYVFHYDGQNWVQQEPPIKFPGSGSGPMFGISVAAHGNTIVVGSKGNLWGEDGSFLQLAAGSIFIYESGANGVWNFVDEFAPTQADLGGNYAFSADVVAIDGPWIVTGAPEQKNKTGAAYLYHHDGHSWSYIEKLPAPGFVGQGYLLGQSIAISGGRAAVGVPKLFSTQPPGEVYLYDLSPVGTAVPTVVTSAHATSGHYFGRAVSKSNSALAVGAVTFTNGETLGSGGAFVFSPIGNAAGALCDPAPPEPADSCPADLNGDGKVSVQDLLALVIAWGPCSGSCPADLNGDGVVNVHDLLLVMDAWGPCDG